MRQRQRQRQGLCLELFGCSFLATIVGLRSSFRFCPLLSARGLGNQSRRTRIGGVTNLLVILLRYTPGPGIQRPWQECCDTSIQNTPAFSGILTTYTRISLVGRGYIGSETRSLVLFFAGANQHSLARPAAAGRPGTRTLLRISSHNR